VGVILLAAALTAFGQRHRIDSVDTEKPGGKLLQQALQENDPARKAAALELFANQFPKDPATAAVLEMLQGIYVKTSDPDKVIATGERLIAVDPDDPEPALQSLKAAEARKDLTLIKKWSNITSGNARKMAGAPQPSEADQVETWKQNVDYAKQVDNYADYALFRAAVESRDPKVTIDFLETLEQRSPQSEYVTKGRESLFVAYRQSGSADKALALAERVLATDQSNEDMLLVVTDHYLQSKTEPEKVHAYSAKIVELMAAKAKPQGASDADWTARKNLVVGLAHYMDGKLYYNEGRFPQADQELRRALPLVEGNATLKPEVLYLLGFANYKLEKPQDAADFYKECAAIKSAFQATAAKNLQGIKTQYHGIR